MKDDKYAVKRSSMGIMVYISSQIIPDHLERIMMYFVDGTFGLIRASECVYMVICTCTNCTSAHANIDTFVHRARRLFPERGRGGTITSDLESVEFHVLLSCLTQLLRSDLVF